MRCHGPRPRRLPWPVGLDGPGEGRPGGPNCGRAGSDAVPFSPHFRPAFAFVPARRPGRLGPLTRTVVLSASFGAALTVHRHAGGTFARRFVLCRRRPIRKTRRRRVDRIGTDGRRGRRPGVALHHRPVTGIGRGSEDAAAIDVYHRLRKGDRRNGLIEPITPPARRKTRRPAAGGRWPVVDAGAGGGGSCCRKAGPSLPPGRHVNTACQFSKDRPFPQVGSAFARSEKSGPSMQAAAMLQRVRPRPERGASGSPMG